MTVQTTLTRILMHYQIKKKTQWEIHQHCPFPKISNVKCLNFFIMLGHAIGNAETSFSFLLT